MRYVGVELEEQDYIPKISDSYEDGETFWGYEYWENIKEDWYQESKLDEAKNK